MIAQVKPLPWETALALAIVFTIFVYVILHFIDFNSLLTSRNEQESRANSLERELVKLKAKQAEEEGKQ